MKSLSIRKSLAAVVLTASAFLCQPLRAQGIEYVRAHYTKYEFMVPMRDGKKLFTSVYVPKDTSKTYPIMLSRTPYSVAPYGINNYRDSLGPSELFAKDGFIFAYQDVRGRIRSEGEFANMTPHRPVKRAPADTDESTDTYDTVDWLVKNIANNNGRVGQWGISYPGFYAAAGMIDAHPALKAASPQAPICDWFIGDDFHHNGVFYLAHAFNFFSIFGRIRPDEIAAGFPRFNFGTPDGYQFYLNMGPLRNANEKYLKNEDAFWNEMMQHANYDAFWQGRNLRPHLKNIKPAVMTVGGWFDAEDLYGALNVYQAVEESSPGANNMLVMGPWFHGGWARSDGDALGDVRFDSKTGVFYREKIEFPFFSFHLKDSPDPKLPEAYVFETGRNQWRALDAWPPKSDSVRTLYLHAGGRLSFDPPTGEAEGAYDEYISDPAKPVPYIGYVAIGMTREHMVDDQRFASRRTDVLTYQTDALEGDIVVAGPVVPSLQVSTSGTDSDWVVKLIDVYPDDAPDNQPNPKETRMAGYQQLVRGEAIRGRFRNSFEKPEPFEPGKIAKVEYKMPDVYHAFRRGHRIMIQIQSSWFPLVDRNPQQFVDIYNARESDFKKAAQRVYRSRAVGSAVRLTVPD
jgi:putative CocE/NonD family hydrolase